MMDLTERHYVRSDVLNLRPSSIHFPSPTVCVPLNSLTHLWKNCPVDLSLAVGKNTLCSNFQLVQKAEMEPDTMYLPSTPCANMTNALSRDSSVLWCVEREGKRERGRERERVREKEMKRERERGRERESERERER
jgi:hypothetical protein